MEHDHCRDVRQQRWHLDGFPEPLPQGQAWHASAIHRLWSQLRTARQAGIHIGVIAIPNKGTLQVGAERFYTYFVDELGITDFQINTSFSGREPNDVKHESILDMDGLSQFCVDLATVWVERGYEQGVKLSPFDQLLRHFTGKAPACRASGCRTAPTNS